MIVKKHSELFQ